MSRDLSDMTLEELWELFPIIFKEHNPAYADWYEEEKVWILPCLAPGELFRIQHIGSTAVKGLTAKPTVDILLEITESCRTDRLRERLLQSGRILMNVQEEPLRWVFNKGYTPQGFAEKVYHLHVRPAADWDELYFRDYLRENSAVRKEYAALKLRLQKQYEHDRDGYTDAKTGFIRQATQTARRLYGDSALYKSVFGIKQRGGHMAAALLYSASE